MADNQSPNSNVTSPSFTISTATGSIRKLKRSPAESSQYEQSINSILLSPASEEPSTLSTNDTLSKEIKQMLASPSERASTPLMKTARSNIAVADFASPKQSPLKPSPSSASFARSPASATSSSAATLSPTTPSTPFPPVDANGTTFPLKIPTLTSSLSSGFPYHESLFNVNINPSNWAKFSQAIVKSTKLTFKDRATIGATYGSIALTGLIGTSILVGHKVQRKVQRNRVRTSLASTEEGGLGAVLAEWNANYFSAMGLVAQVCVSEDLLKSELEEKEKGNKGDESRREDFEGIKRQLKKVPFVTVDKEERKNSKDGRKYMIVLMPSSEVPGRLELEGGMENEIEELEGDMGAEIMELEGDLADAQIKELQGDTMRAELPADGVEKLNLKMQTQEPVELDSIPIEVSPPAYGDGKRIEVKDEKSEG